MHSLGRWRALPLLSMAAGVLAFTGITLDAQSVAVDPGVRGGSPGAGGPLRGFTSAQSALFAFVAARFSRIHSVSGQIEGEEAAGLGPGYNGNGCAACHAFPAPGGSSPAVNPQIAMATVDGAQNSIPSFLSPNGPVRVARFIQNADGTPDGGVYDLFTIQGRVDAPGCQLTQPDFAAAMAQNNVVFRIPTPVFGAGLIENISDETILANKYANVLWKRFLGIAGHENRNPNDGTITKFGWKAQNKSLLMFSGEAYNVEIGVTNELFPNERNMAPGCNFNPQPEDRLNFDANSSNGGETSDFQNFTTFMRLLAPPAPAPDNPSIANGRALFTPVGCALCHTPSLETSGSVIPGLSLQTANLYSDLLVHHMGAGLADGIQQGSAGPDEFRTAPLWGLGQRIYFLHDGRTADLLQAIQAHHSSGSEANKTIDNFNALTVQQQQDLLNFLRSL
ncbi:MAG TPA: di-heme oxidoredictase family protein [Bryobacteraceae bacterium]|nr:di-heme oxidoredictase family protein [Bryobacteraceae bacterium]